MSKKMKIVIPKEIGDKPVEWLERDEVIMDFLRKKGYLTVRDVIRNQDHIPKKYMVEINMKLIFNI